MLQPDRCPFCGALPAAELKVMEGMLVAYVWRVWCSVCHALGPVKPLQAEAVEAWNRRSLGRAER